MTYILGPQQTDGGKPRQRIGVVAGIILTSVTAVVASSAAWVVTLIIVSIGQMIHGGC